jgi:hypothetical protein
VAALADHVVFVAAGLPLVLKSSSPHPALHRLRGRVTRIDPVTPSPASGGGSGWGC